MMMRNLKMIGRSNTMGQSIAEYGILISVVTAALLAMQIYMKRGIQAAIKYSTDQFGNQDYRETNPEKVAETNMSLQTMSDSTLRRQQESVASGVRTTYTTSALTNNTGVSVFVQEDEL